MSAPLENLSSRNADLSKVIHKLKGVIKRHNGNYLAFCPSHDDRKGRSLAIAVGRENQILMHCFAGCSIHEITSAIGLNLSDLFPCNDNTYITQTRSYLNEWQILEALQFDALLPIFATHSSSIVRRCSDGAQAVVAIVSLR